VTLVLLSACLRTDVPDRERPALLTARDLAPFGISVPDPARHESLKRHVHFDGAHTIEYEYSEEPDSTGLYLYISIDVERNPRSARHIVATNKAAMLAGYWLEKIEVRSDSTMQYGDDSYFGALLRDSTEVGKLAVARRGLIVYTVVLSGYLLDSGEWRSLLDAKFRHADSSLPASSRRLSPRR
jgi:hypothetical protein